MGKHKTANQNAMMLDFMERNPDIARGFTKRDKVAVEEQWKVLVESLNSDGPPTKNITEWKKTWADWKSEVRKKLAHNKREAIATGGGPFKKYTLSDVEENVARVSGLYAVVDGVSGETSIGVGEEDFCEVASNFSGDEMPSTSRRAQELDPSLPPTPKRRKKEPSLQETVKTFINVESAFHESLAENVSELAKSTKENEKSLRRVYRSIDNVNSTLQSIRKDFKDHHLKTQKALVEKNRIKLRQLEIEEIRLEIDRNRKN